MQPVPEGTPEYMELFFFKIFALKGEKHNFIFKKIPIMTSELIDLQKSRFKLNYQDFFLEVIKDLMFPFSG